MKAVSKVQCTVKSKGKLKAKVYQREMNRKVTSIFSKI